MEGPATRAARPRDRKSQLAEVASELFRNRGYHGVGINDIAAAAGITGPALYRHFTDKQAILAHVLLDGIAEMESVTASALARAEIPAPQEVSALLSALAKHAVERRATVALWRWEGRNLDRHSQRTVAARSGAVLNSWASALTRIRPELPRADAELLCWAAWSVFGSVAVHRTTVAKRKFADLLVELAKRVLHARLPAADTRTQLPVPGVTLSTPTRREQLLRAATDLFHQHGYHPVSMEDIGAAAGIAGPSVYRHFPSKASLLSAICQRAADRLMLGTEYALHTSEPPDERVALRRLAESYVRTLTGSAELAVSFAIPTINVPERDRRELLRIQRDYVAQWVTLLTSVRPELTAHEAKITVHAALTIANDLTRTRRMNARPQLNSELITVLVAVLDLN